MDWDLYLGPAAWRPFNKKLLDGFNFEKGGGLTGGGCLEWGSHCVDLCQWANDADRTAPVEYEPVGNELHARYANGVKLVLRDDGWLPLGSCPVRFEGDTGWVETGDDGDLVASTTPCSSARRPRSPATPPTSISATSWTASARAARPAPTPTPPAMRTSPATRPTSPCS